MSPAVLQKMATIKYISAKADVRRQRSSIRVPDLLRKADDGTPLRPPGKYCEERSHQPASKQVRVR